jgi:uncharacterized protein (TIGR00251 family)
MTLRVKVIPRSAKTEIVGEMSDGTLKIKIAAPPEKGKANAELIRFLAAYYGVNRVEIISGHTASLKMVRI